MATTTKRKTSTSSKRQSSSRKNSSVSSIENGIKIVRLALRKKISVSTASQELKRGKNYISDIKARLEENYKSRNISRDNYSTFKSLYKDYAKNILGK